jgi:hypothetical protein
MQGYEGEEMMFQMCSMQLVNRLVQYRAYRCLQGSHIGDHVVSELLARRARCQLAITSSVAVEKVGSNLPIRADFFNTHRASHELTLPQWDGWKTELLLSG